MRLRPFVVIVLEALVFLTLIFLSSCAVPTAVPPPAATEATEEASTPETVQREVEPTVTPEEVRAEACKSYMDLRPEEIFNHYSSPIFWTFYTNFYDPEDEADPSIRLGCWRFYWRDKPNSVYTSTLLSTVVIECHAVGSVQTETADNNAFTVSSSNNLRVTGHPTMPDRRAHFDVDSYLWCPFDLNEVLDNFRNTTDFTDEMATLGLDDADMSLAVDDMIADAHDSYDEFTMAAAAEGENEETMTATLIFDQPELGGEMTEEIRPGYEISFSVKPSEDEPHARFETRLGEFQTNSDLSTGPFDDCKVPLPAFYGWSDFGECSAEGTVCTPGAGYLNRAIGDPPLSMCPIPNAPDMPSQVAFWASTSTLYIGYDPETGIAVTEPLIFYEAWVDPDNVSRPPGG